MSSPCRRTNPESDLAQYLPVNRNPKDIVASGRQLHVLKSEAQGYVIIKGMTLRKSLRLERGAEVGWDHRAIGTEDSDVAIVFSTTFFVRKGDADNQRDAMQGTGKAGAADGIDPTV